MAVRISNKPLRRLVHQGGLGGGFDQPFRRLVNRSLGALPATSYVMGILDVNDFQHRHPDVDAVIKQFEYLVREYGYDQLSGTTTWDQATGIPPGGITVNDAVYGTVLIHPDANGVLQYDGNISAATAAGVNKPVYQSPVGGGPAEDLANWLKELQKSIGTVGTVVAVGVGGYLAIQLLQLVKKR